MNILLNTFELYCDTRELDRDPFATQYDHPHYAMMGSTLPCNTLQTSQQPSDVSDVISVRATLRSTQDSVILAREIRS
jgi:hypothetical protein